MVRGGCDGSVVVVVVVVMRSCWQVLVDPR